MIKQYKITIFILTMITITLIGLVTSANAEENVSNQIIEETQTQIEQESEFKNDNNTLNIDTTISQESTEDITTSTTLNEIRDTLYIIASLLFVLIGVFLGYIAISRLM